MRHPRLIPFHPNAPGARTLALATLALGALLAAWAGCSASGSETTSSHGTTGAGNSTGSKMAGSGGTGGAGGATGGSATGGADAGPNCNANEKVCDGMCVMIGDPAYGCAAGTCVPCAPPGMNATATCVMMGGTQSCAIQCTAGFSNCDGNPGNGCETDTSTDPNNCGACGAPCSVPHATPACSNGMCEVGTCDSGWVDCDGNPANGCESNPNSDDDNCGSCGVVCPSPLQCGLVSNDQDAGTITDNDGGPPLNDAGVPIASCNLYCPKGKTNCDGNPLDGCNVQLGTNQDCNFCGDTCDLANAMSSCGPSGMNPPSPAYVCTLNQCNPGWANCDMMAANGCETNTNTDANNCGSCGNKCPSGPHSTAVCVNGGCAINCDPGYADCDNNPNDGCEIYTNGDVDNCGMCSHVCITANATPTCSNGMCEIQSCNTGFMDCNMNPVDGCEINTTNNPNDCGACGAVCGPYANATPGCANSMCDIAGCNPGYSDCDMQVSDGCEDPTGTDVNNCGTCGNKCSLPNATPTCAGGTCEISACNPGYQDCDHQPNDGCEVNTTNDPMNCGACNHQCFVANGTAGCENGMCVVASCNPGYADCDNNPSDGCETQINTTSNCGACTNNCNTDCVGNVSATECNGNLQCEVLACDAGYYDIDGNCSNGCECLTRGTSSTCTAPTSLGTLAVGNTITYTGNLVPAGQQAYLEVTFTGNTNFAFHPKVVLTTGASEFEFDIEVNCTPMLESCGVEGTSSSGDTTWEEEYTAGDPNNSTQFQPIPLPGTNGTILIHVYRRNGQPVTCDNYELTISE